MNCNYKILVGLIIVGIIILLIIRSSDKKEKFTNWIEVDGAKSYAGLTNNSDNPWSIDRQTKATVQQILKQILNIINDKTNMSYYLMSFDQLKHDKIGENKFRYVADFFVHEMRNLHTRRMIVIFKLNINTRDVEVEHINLSNAFKNPSKDFMDYPAPALILQDDNLLSNEYHIMGVNKSTIDFSILNTSKPKEVPTPTEFQKWILPMGIAAAYQNPQAMFPNRKQSDCWDTYGVNYIEGQYGAKFGVKNTQVAKYPYPYDNPSINRQRDASDPYNWQQDLVLNTSGIGRGVAGSP